MDSQETRMKYALYIIKGNDKKLIQIYDEKAQALKKGTQIHEQLSRKAGVVWKKSLIKIINE